MLHHAATISYMLEMTLLAQWQFKVLRETLALKEKFGTARGKEQFKKVNRQAGR